MPAESPDGRTPNPERVLTDESLRIEREKADDALAHDAATIEETADAVIEKARARADALLAAARAKTDGQAGAPDPQASRRTATRRAQEDEAVRDERADADEIVRAERAEQVALLSVERKDTDQDLLEERARADGAVATRDDFLGIVSHDLRNLLHSMLGFAHLIGESAKLEDRRAQIFVFSQRIERAGSRMNRLIGDLLDVASIEAGRLAVTREAGDPSHVVTEAVETFQAQAVASSVSLVAQVQPLASPATFDPARMLQVLTNLVSNAIKFTPKGGSVVVRLYAVGDELHFAVSDTGIGIPADKLESVFERFNQGTANDRRGVGLGLYISKCIVEGHGGRIWAESKEGEGSTFTFTLPAPTAMSPGPGSRAAAL